MGLSPIIGNVFDGVDISVIMRKFINDYVEVSLDECNKCWASKLCGICYAKNYTEEGIDIQKKRKSCSEARYSAYKSLILYYDLYEKDAKFLKRLNDIELV